MTTNDYPTFLTYIPCELRFGTSGLRGLVREMTDLEVFNLIFAPGFSTAKKVSSVSGRGVGMDVVKTNITKINVTRFPFGPQHNLVG